MNDDEINKLFDEFKKITKAERVKSTKCDKLSLQERLAQEKGFANKSEYLNWLAQQKGFTNNTEYDRNRRFKKGIGSGLSMTENKNSSNYLGIYIAERLLHKIFDKPKMMPFGNKGYDAICKNGYKIDVKSSSLRKANCWNFAIRNNKVADAFMCIGFSGSREDLDVKHIWLIPATEIIRTKPLNKLTGLGIYDTNFSLSKIAKYELVDKVSDANNVCMLFKQGVLR